MTYSQVGGAAKFNELLITNQSTPPNYK